MLIEKKKVFVTFIRSQIDAARAQLGSPLDLRQEMRVRADNASIDEARGYFRSPDYQAQASFPGEASVKKRAKTGGTSWLHNGQKSLFPVLKLIAKCNLAHNFFQCVEAQSGALTEELVCCLDFPEKKQM